MDTGSAQPADPPLTGLFSGFGGDLVVTGMGHADGDADPRPFLRIPKQRKFMGKQDAMAVVAAARALGSAGLAAEPLGERTGLYLVVGFIPFEAADVDRLLAASLDASGAFSMAPSRPRGSRRSTRC